MGRIRVPCYSSVQQGISVSFFDKLSNCNEQIAFKDEINHKVSFSLSKTTYKKYMIEKLLSKA